MLEWAGYTADSPLTPQIYTVIKSGMVYIPFVLSALGVIGFLLFYDLDKKMPQIRAELKERRAKQEAQPDV
jgi:GPH family glycoside/pentoside/hexuronide:cation symporter